MLLLQVALYGALNVTLYGALNVALCGSLQGGDVFCCFMEKSLVQVEGEARFHGETICLVRWKVVQFSFVKCSYTLSNMGKLKKILKFFYDLEIYRP